MAGMKKSRNRIEPSFGAPEDDDSDDDIRVDSSDRVIGGRSKAPSRKKSKKDEPLEGEVLSRRARWRERERSTGLFGWIRRLFYWCIVLGIWGTIGVVGMVIYFASQMPSASTWQVPARAPNIKIVATDGTLIANRGVTGGEALPLDEMSPYMPEAIVAIEDKRFYSHFGVDFIGIGRAFVTNILLGHRAQGASTITQQLARNLFLSPKKTFERKVQEVLLSLWLEQKYTKDQILAMYLNRVYFGDNAYGVEAASRRYFNKSARDINLGEAALLAGLVQAPSRLSPVNNPKPAEDRAKIVLGAMREQGYITDSDFNRAMKQTPDHAKRQTDGSGQYVADMVAGQLKGLIGDVKQDIVVTTTIDPALESAAQTAIATTLDKDGKKFNATQAALVAVDGNGAVRALVGGRDYATSQYNRAVTAKRQPGSSFKPFVYATAMEMGDTPETVMNDGPVKIGNWTPENYEQKYNGPVTLAYALANSLNTIAAQLVMKVGPDQVIKMAHRLGIESDLQNNASIALGTSEVSLLELTSAYAPFMNGGFKATSHVISQITDTDGKVLYTADYGEPPRVLSQKVVTEMTQMMEGVITNGTGKAARLKNWQAAGKTGTTQSYRDALFVGFTSNLTTGVWFGNDDGTPMKRVTGGGLPAKTWKDFMTAAQKGLTPVPLFGDPTPQTDQEPSLTSMIRQVLSGTPSTPENEYPPAPQPVNPLPPGSPQPANPALNQDMNQPQAAYPPANYPNAAQPNIRQPIPPQPPQQGVPPRQQGQYGQGRYEPENRQDVDPYNDPYSDPGNGRPEGPLVLEGRVPPGQEPQGYPPVQNGYPPVQNDYPGGNAGATPPADVGGRQRTQGSRGDNTTLLDVLMGR
ncbi:transglycosylase domain-containing protein [Allorhizobium terrae]|uniref:PBP1A family penicillin-binding protein n=1 Tax=Allorhizobium terrae TaxID=1848972 RepID=A0A4S3ZTS1_9HYPH|nr:transglycosylase domain-containing protein [Allorhizobium terrae]THF49018.1 PBP1A family penicillin-binding protein [Allorhizobium terrae]